MAGNVVSKRIARVAFAASFGSLLAACYFTSSFEGLSNGGASTSSSSSSGSTSEGGLDGSSSSSGSTDAQSADGPVSAFCTGATFCDEFERAAPVAGAWDRTEIENESSLVLSTERAHSGATSLHAELGAPDFAAASVVKELPPFKILKYSYSCLFPKSPRHANMTAVEIEYDGHYSQLFMIMESDALQFAEQEFTEGDQSFYVGYNQLTPLPLGQWIDVTITIDLTDPNVARLSTTINGTPLDTAMPLGRKYPPRKAKLSAGIAYSSPGAKFDVFFDDFRIDVTPPQ